MDILALPADHPEKKLHLERYQFACQHAYGQVLDLACGTGYGSALLLGCTDVDSVLGIDYCQEAIDQAREQVQGPDFYVADLDKWVPSVAVDTVVTLETIEHLRDPDAFVRKIQRVANVIILSTPIIPTVGRNPFHLHDFTLNQVAGWFDESWTCRSCWIQEETYVVACYERL